MLAKVKQTMWAWRGVLVAVPTVAGVVIALRLLGLLQLLELATLDQLFQLRPREEVDTRIVIVTIGETDLQQLKEYPFSDAKLAQVLRHINQQQPAAIGLDLYRDLPVEPGKQELEQVFKATPNLIGVQKVVSSSDSSSVAPPPVLKQQDQVGANDLVLDTDGRVRRGLFYLSDPTGNPIFSFSFKLAYRYLDQKGVRVDQNAANQIYAGSTVFPRLRGNDGGYVQARDEGYQVLLNYRSETQGFRTLSFTEVLENRIPPDFMRDRIVLIGSTAESLKDLYHTPFNNQIFGAPKRMAGVTIHANLISQIISSALDDRQLIRTWPEWGEWLWILGWASLGGIICWQQRLSSGSTKFLFLKRFRLVVAGACLITGVYLAFLLGWWIPLVPALMGLTGAAFSVTGYLAHNATEMRKTFGRYLTDEVVANLLETPSGLQLGGERRKVTVLMSDVRGFSALSEWLPPEKVVALLNQYLGAMADVVDQYKGTINEFIGDGIFVMFGAPISRPDDAQRAIACAVAMQQAMHTVNENNRQVGLPAIDMGIGINTGEVVVGNVGSQRRAKYTVIGRHVNLAARIESYTVGGQILVSENTLKDAECEVQILGELRVEPKGIRTPMTVYEVGGIGGKYQLSLPISDDTMLPLRREVVLEYTVLEGKHAVGNLFQGRFTKLSKSGAELQTEQPLDVLSNLKLHLSGVDRAQLSGDLYAKVIKQVDESAHRFDIRFTSVPPEIAIALQALQDSGHRSA